MKISVLPQISRRGELELIFPTESGGKYLKYFVLPKFYDLLVLQWIKKYAKDPHRGVARLQKLAESQVCSFDFINLINNDHQCTLCIHTSVKILSL